jgi:hypothetical protein
LAETSSPRKASHPRDCGCDPIAGRERAEPTRWAPWTDARTVGAAGLRPAWSSAAGGRRLRRLPSKWASGNVTARFRAGTAPAAGWLPVPPRTKPGLTGCSPVGVVPPGGQWPLRYCAGVSTLSRSSLFLLRETTTRASVRRLGPSRWAAWVAARRFSESSMTSGWLLQRKRQGRRPRGPVGKIRIHGWMQKERGRALQAHDPIT